MGQLGVNGQTARKSVEMVSILDIGFMKYWQSSMGMTAKEVHKAPGHFAPVTKSRSSSHRIRQLLTLWLNFIQVSALVEELYLNNLTNSF